MRTKIQFKNIKDLPVHLTDWIGSAASLVVHTLIFIASFTLIFFGIPAETVLLVLTTIVSLEAIYLAIFIQMTVNRNTQSLDEVEEDIEEIQENVDEIQEDVDEIQEDIDEIQEDVDEIQEEEVTEEAQTQVLLGDISQRLQALIADIESMKRQK